MRLWVAVSVVVAVAALAGEAEEAWAAEQLVAVALEFPVDPMPAISIARDAAIRVVAT